MVERRGPSRMDANEWIRRRDKLAEAQSVVGDPNKTAELLKRLRDNPDLTPKRGRPPMVKPAPEINIP